MPHEKPYRQIILADDDEDDRLIFRDALKEVSPAIDCVIASNGKVVIEKLEKSASLPDMLFLDINMPLVNGFECLATLKNAKKFAQIPIVILSTASNNSAFETAHALGADAFMIKPSSHKELVDKLRKIFKMEFSQSDKIDPDYSRFLVQ